MSMTVSIRLEHREAGRAGGQRSHDLRQGRIPGYVDRSRTQHNSVLIEPQDEAGLRAIIAERRVGKKRALMSNASLSCNGILTFGREAQEVMSKLSVAEQDELIFKSCEDVARKLDNTLAGLVVHRDEQAIHAHLQLPSWTLSGKAVSTVINRELASELQDVAAEAFSCLNISRGVKKEERIKNGEKPKHKSVKELHETERADGFVRQENPVLFLQEDPELLAIEQQERADEIIFFQRQAVEALLRDEQIRPTRKAERWIFQLHEEIERERKIEEIHAKVDGTKVLESGDESTVPLDKLFNTQQIRSEPEKEVFPARPSEKESGAGGFDLPNEDEDEDSRPGF